jgi:hypothetical protein
MAVLSLGQFWRRALGLAGEWLFSAIRKYASQWWMRGLGLIATAVIAGLIVNYLDEQRVAFPWTFDQGVAGFQSIIVSALIVLALLYLIGVIRQCYAIYQGPANELQQHRDVIKSEGARLARILPDLPREQLDILRRLSISNSPLKPTDSHVMALRNYIESLHEMGDGTVLYALHEIAAEVAREYFNRRT